MSGVAAPADPLHTVEPTRRLGRALVVGAALLLFAAACGDDASDTASETSAAAEGGTCDRSALPLTTEGELTVATGEPAFSPWVENDDPAAGKGYEAALVSEIADELGLDSVSWVRTGFDEAVAPGEKDYDFNIQQYSITDQRKKVVDFSQPYYTVQQAVVGAADGALKDAKGLDDLKTARLGAAIGTTSLDYIEQFIEPDTEPLVFDDNAAAKAAFDAGQVDGIVFDLPTAYYVTAVEIEGSSIIGILPSQGEAEELGMLFEKGSELVPCVDEALATLREDGRLADLETTWLAQGGDIPTLDN